MRDFNLNRYVSVHSKTYKQLVDYFDWCLNVKKLSYFTVRGRADSLRDLLRYKPLHKIQDLSTEIFNGWIKEQNLRGNKARTINTRINHIKEIVTWFMGDGVHFRKLKLSRVENLRNQPPRKLFYTIDQVYDVLNKADRQEWLWIKLMFDCGLRRSELAYLRLRDIDGRKIRIIGKYSKQRFAVMSPEVRERLDQYIEFNKITDWLWASPSSCARPLDPNSIYVHLKKVFRKAGYPEFYPHALRHSYATDLKFLHLDNRQIQAGLGHSTEEVTEHYLHDLDGFDIEEVYEAKYNRPQPKLL